MTWGVIKLEGKCISSHSVHTLVLNGVKGLKRHKLFSAATTFSIDMVGGGGGGGRNFSILIFYILIYLLINLRRGRHGDFLF